MHLFDCPRSLRFPAAIADRKGMIHDPHIAPLSEFVAKLRRANPDWEFPEFDPLDGGVTAEVLFLFEKPGPMTSAGGRGSGFISRDNDDPTAETTFSFMNQAKLPRRCTVIWNIVPGWNGSRTIKSAEVRAGIDSLKVLLSLLPNLHTIVLVGRKAQRAMHLVAGIGVRVLASPHPSPLVRAALPNRWREIPAIWAQARIKS